MEKFKCQFEYRRHNEKTSAILDCIEHYEKRLKHYKEQYQLEVFNLIKEIVKDYEADMSTLELSEKYNIPQRTIHDWIFKSGTKMRRIKQKFKDNSNG